MVGVDVGELNVDQQQHLRGKIRHTTLPAQTKHNYNIPVYWKSFCCQQMQTWSLVLLSLSRMWVVTILSVSSLSRGYESNCKHRRVCRKKKKKKQLQTDARNPKLHNYTLAHRAELLQCLVKIFRHSYSFTFFKFCDIGTTNLWMFYWDLMRHTNTK